MTTTRPELDQHTFFSGLMLALRLRRDTFVAEGPKFHRAFLAVVKKAEDNGPVILRNARWIRMDPVFGVVPEANEMLLEAEHDRLVAFLNPRLQMAQFKIDADQAASELAQLGESREWFEELGSFFHDQLESTSVES